MLPARAQSEVFVLAYTEEILASEEARLDAALKAVEKKKGVAVRAPQGCGRLGAPHVPC